MMIIGDRLKTIRKILSKTQEEMALMLGVKRATYASYEINRASVDYELLKKLSKISGVSVEELEKPFENNSVIQDGEIARLKNEIEAMNRKIKVLTLEVVQLKSQVTKKSATKISLEIDMLME